MKIDRSMMEQIYNLLKTIYPIDIILFLQNLQTEDYELDVIVN